jgi:hypothetical protein
MPYEIKPVNGGFAVFNKQTGERKNEKPKSKKSALAYLKALYFNVGKKE